MQTYPSSETVLLASNSPPVLRNSGDDVDIDFGDVFGGPPKRRSKVMEVTRHSFSETALRRSDVIAADEDDDGVALIPSDVKDEKPVFGEESSIRRRFTADDFFNDIFRVNEEKKKESSLSTHLKAESLRTSSPAQFSLPAKLIKTTEIPTFGSSTPNLIKRKETTSSSPLSSKIDKISTAKSDSDAPQVVTGKGRQFHFSIYKWPNKGVPVIIWGSSRLSSMSKSDETTLSDSHSSSVKKAGLKEETTKLPSVQTKEGSMSEKAFSVDVSKEDRQGKSKAKNTRIFVGDSRSKKKTLDKRSSLDSPIPDKPSSSSASEVGKGKVMDFVKKFSQGTSEESLGKSSRWRAKETTRTDINRDGAKAKETVNIHDHDQQKKPTPDVNTMDQDQKPSQTTQKTDSNRESVKNNKTSGVFEQEKRQEPSTEHTTSEDIDEPFHVNFMVEEITQDENQIEETKSDVEEIQNIDAKIRKWSSGKSGNIRSLLSTLQYILWPESGWKAVPLMDMIEGNAVRKSYQRALLILHPDKLQQKGASTNQKYMADKVFELLQEAWDHFNTLGPV